MSTILHKLYVVIEKWRVKNPQNFVNVVYECPIIQGVPGKIVRKYF